jgi:NADH-quinone oxidoreductase subunit H
MFFPAFAVLAVISLRRVQWRGDCSGGCRFGAVFYFGGGEHGIYALILAGYASRSKYPALSGVRAAAQLISYEIAMVLALLSVGFWAPSFRLSDIVAAQGLRRGGLFSSHFRFYLSGLFVRRDQSRAVRYGRAEQEIAGGYNVEYGALGFGMFFGRVCQYDCGHAVFICLFWVVDATVCFVSGGLARVRSFRCWFSA